MLGKRFLSAVLAEGKVSSFLQYGSIDYLFKASELPVYEFVRDFVKQYHALPSEGTIEAHTGETLTPHEEPADYYLDLMKIRHIELSLKQAMKSASDLLLPENKDPEKALEEITKTCMGLIARRYQTQVVDFRDAYDLVMPDYVAKYTKEDDNRLYLGWPTLDKMTGGLTTGDMVSYVGLTGQGKTWSLLYGAHYGWANQTNTSRSRMFVSMEMTPLAIEQRLAAMQAQIPAMQLKNATLTTTGLKKLKEGLTEIKSYDAPFWIVDGNLAATVEDIWMLARQLKPDAIFVDGAYLVKHPTERDRYRRVAENADLIKKELAAIAPTVCSWQFAKTANKKNAKKGEKVGLDDIGYSHAIAEVSSIVLGLFEEDSVATIKSRKVEILKGRNGETGSFTTNWRFDVMDFSEVEEEAVEDLVFV